MEGDAFDFIKILYSFAFVVGLLLLTLWVFRKMGLEKYVAGTGRKTARLAICDSLILDAKRKLVLLRCDDKEYLVLMGPTGDTTLQTLSLRQQELKPVLSLPEGGNNEAS